MSIETDTKEEKYLVYGLTLSYFTRKFTSYCAYKQIPYRLVIESGRNLLSNKNLQQYHYEGGIPVVVIPKGPNNKTEPMWDTTAMMLYLERKHRDAERSILPTHSKTMQFLNFLIEDYSDEWINICAPGTRWNIEENAKHAGLEIAKEIISITGQKTSVTKLASSMGGSFIKGIVADMGYDKNNGEAWISHVLLPWFQLLHNHFSESKTPFLFGKKPSLADFAIFGGSSAHFVNDPSNRKLCDEHAIELIAHTNRLLEGHHYKMEDPIPPSFGNWLSVEETLASPTLFAIIKHIGEYYLPWAAKACDKKLGEKVHVPFGAQVPATAFFRQSRAVMLARYIKLRSPELDEYLSNAGVLQYFSNFVNNAAPPEFLSYFEPPRPVNNRSMNAKVSINVSNL